MDLKRAFNEARGILSRIVQTDDQQELCQDGIERARTFLRENPEVA